MNKIYTTFLVLVFSAGLLRGQVQTNNESHNKWLRTWAYPSAFTENNGQFTMHKSDEKVLFAYANGATTVYFTQKGVRYSLLKRWPVAETEDERKVRRAGKFAAKSWMEREKFHRQMAFEADVVSFDWEGANSDVEIFGIDETYDYHNYSIVHGFESPKVFNNIKSYKKLLYKNIYPLIDVCFEFHPQGGLKYSLILHPGADVSMYKKVYNRDVKINNENQLIIPSKFGAIVEHVPYTHYADNEKSVIGSSFKKHGQTIGFELESYNKQRLIVIDPWVQLQVLPNSNCVWECEADSLGNVYIIGGDMPMTLQKYDSTGVLQWTFYTPWDTASFWLGTLATDRQGNSYVSSGSSAQIIKADANGNQVWATDTTDWKLLEYWDMTFNCDQSKLIVGGTHVENLDMKGIVFDIDASNGLTNSSLEVSYSKIFLSPPIVLNEVRSLTVGPSGKYYFLTHDTIGCLWKDFNASPSSIIFRENSTHYFSYRCENYRPSNANGGGIKAIKAGHDFLYTHSGRILHKRSLVTGAILDSVLIPGGLSTTSLGEKVVGNSGLDIDSCGNIYVGSGNCVLKYDAALTMLDSVQVPYKVFDVIVSNGGNVIVCGATGTSSNTNRTGYVQSVNLSACAPQTNNCLYPGIAPAGPFCMDAPPVTLTVDTSGGTFSGTAVDALTGVFSPALAGFGNHTITYTFQGLSDSITIVVDSCATITVCSEPTGLLTVSGGTAPYTWQANTLLTSPITNQAECLACGYTWNPTFNECRNGWYTVTTCSTYVWSNFDSGSSITSPANYPIRVVDVNGDSAIFANFSSVPPCFQCTTYTISVTNISDVNCIGGSDGSFTAETCGGVAPYSYALLLGTDTIDTILNINSPQTFTGLIAGDYMLIVTDSTGFADSISVIVNENVFTPSASVNGPVCEGLPISFSAQGGSVFSWSGPNGFVSTLPNPVIPVAALSDSGSYSVTISSLPCTIDITLDILINPKPTEPDIIFNPPCLHTNLQLSAYASPGAAFSWFGPDSFASNLQNPVINNFSQANNGMYSLYITDTIGCVSDTATATISHHIVTDVYLGFNLMFCENEAVILNAGTGYTSYLWNTGDTTSSIYVSGTIMGIGSHPFWVLVTDNNGCVSQDTVIVIFRDCTGMNETNTSELIVYPNPTDNFLHVVLPDYFSGTTILNLHDISGKQILEKTVTEKNISIDMKPFSAGMYYLKVINSDRILTKELIVK